MRWKIRESQQLRPFGGHHLTSHGILFSGETVQEVISKIKAYRINNMLPVGDPMEELLQYYSAKWPFMVDEDFSDKKPVLESETRKKWVEWIRKNWKSPKTKHIAQKEAEHRWKICLNCPHNIPIETVTQEEREMSRKSFLMSRGMTMPAKLGFCSLHMADIRSMVVLEAPSVASDKPKDAANYPGCWVA